MFGAEEFKSNSFLVLEVLMALYSFLFSKTIRVFRLTLFVAVGGALGSIGAFSDDWPQYHGPNRDRISNEKNWQAQWPAEGPNILWRAKIGKGFAAISVKDGRAFAVGNENDLDTVWCFKADTGEELWKFSYKCDLFPNMHEGGPGGSPTVTDKYVYNVSKDGQMYCLDVRDGSKVWFKDLKEYLGVQMPTWRFANSPLLENNQLIVDVGVIAALNPENGDVIWKTKNYGEAYSSVVAFNAHGKRLLIGFPGSGLVLLNPETGKELSSYSWETKYGINATTPVVKDNLVFLSSGYASGAALVEITPDLQLQERWKNKNMNSQINAAVLWDGSVYGFDESILKCLDLQTGEEKWRQRGLGKGSLMLADGKLIILSERGMLIIAEATPNGFNKISEAQVLKGRCWTIPVLANQKIYCRNAEGDTVCVDVSKSS